MEPNSDEKTKIVYRNFGVEFLFCRRCARETSLSRKKELLFHLLAEYRPQKLAIRDPVLELADQYLTQGVLPVTAKADATHAAVATVYELDALISWNLKHLANLNKMAKINAVNLACGYTKKLELITPLEVINHD